MSTKLLISTVFEQSYALFGVEDDRGLILRMSQIGLIYTVLTGIYGVLRPAPYGKHSSDGGVMSWIYGPLINAKLAWMVILLCYLRVFTFSKSAITLFTVQQLICYLQIQETPSWIVPSILMYQSRSVHFGNAPNLILTVLFMTHYIQR